MNDNLMIVLTLLAVAIVALYYYRKPQPAPKESVTSGTIVPMARKPIRPFLLVTRHKGARACKHCAIALVEVARISSRLLNPIDVVYLEDNEDPRVMLMAQYFKGAVPTPTIYYNGQIITGALSPWHMRGMLEGIFGVEE